MRRRGILAGIPIVLALSGYAGTPDPAVPLHPPGMTRHGDKLDFRSDLAFAGDFVKLLVRHGVKVKSLSHSPYNGFFEDTHQAAHISTADGVLEVVFFPYEVRNKVKVSRSYDAEGGVFVFEVQRHPGDPDLTTIDSPCDSAVMMDGKLFILTDSEKLVKSVQRALHPAP